ncbi:hypothetical protein K503DRAFT_430713 [Rhizopogon vinicolor AM-OR11-026]|uniref:Uncharacterized protein n=1 Tax=Rhizopogon vinicolor AM-OR11-026 TaxID=1314800 RepID=A0A1B7MPR2_9AGAM|nr:hypothetical protein K503DRAFT_430713 [Rhizopogon vinicolor AM-OR11-026]
MWHVLPTLSPSAGSTASQPYQTHWENCRGLPTTITYNQPVFLQCIQSYSIIWSYITSHELCVSPSLSLLLLWQHLCLLVHSSNVLGKMSFVSPVGTMTAAAAFIVLISLSANHTDGLAGSMTHTSRHSLLN